MAKQTSIFPPRKLIAALEEYASDRVNELLKPARRDGTKNDASLYSARIGGRRRWFRLKKIPSPRNGRLIVEAARAVKVLDAGERARLRYDANANAAGEQAAQRLFDAAYELGRSYTLSQFGSLDFSILKAKRKRRKIAAATNSKRKQKRPNYREAVRNLLAKGMGLEQARREVAVQFDCSERTVANDTRGMRQEKR